VTRGDCRLSVLPIADSSDFRRVDSRLSDVYADDVDFRSRGHYRPIDTGGGHSVSSSAMTSAASRSRQIYYGAGHHDGYVARSRYSWGSMQLQSCRRANHAGSALITAWPWP